RSADEESLLSRQPSRHGERFLVTHGHEVVDQPHVERPRDLVLTDPLHLVRNTFRFSLTLGPPHLGEDRPHRITGDDLDLWVLLFEISADAGDRTARAGGVHEMRYPSFGLFPDLGTRRVVVRFTGRVAVERM